jgi:hypothetical protein
MMRAPLAALILIPLAVSGACAQTSTQEPILRLTVNPPRVVVGQKTTLRLEVLAPNYMTAPPELPDFQVRNAVTRQLQSVNINEQRDGMTYAGVSFEFAIYPQEPGTYAIAGQKITIHYAAEPPTTRDVELGLPRIDFAAFIPDGAEALRPFVAASKLAIEQTVQRSSDPLKTGDAVTRTVTITAEGTPAMLLPPQTLAAIDGLALYPAQPSLSDHTDGRSDRLTSTRVDSATYMLQRSGDYLLPAIDVSWWNIGEQKIEHSHLDAVPLQVAADPAQPASSGETAISRWNWDALLDFVVDHWLLVMIASIALAALASIAPRTARAVAANHRQRHEAWLRSEAWSFEQFRSAVRRGRAKDAYFALLDWLQRFGPVAPDHSLETLKAAARDPLLDRELGSIERQLFARGSDTGNWSPVQLLRRVSTARRTLQRQATRTETTQPLPQQLNPTADQTSVGRRQRRPAR